jgi:putative thioredoxin
MFQRFCRIAVIPALKAWNDSTMSLPPNFGRAVDLSSLTKPAQATNAIASNYEVTAENFAVKVVELSATKPVILLVWSPRSPESMATLEMLSKLETQSDGLWQLGSINADTEPQVAQALQTKKVPYAVAFIAEQPVPLFDQSYPEQQVKMVIDKVLTLAAEQGIGSAPVETFEPEEDEALAALEAGQYELARAAYQKLVARKPSDAIAKLGLAQTELLIRTEKLEVKSVTALAISEPDNVRAQIDCADLEVISGDLDAAFNRLLECVRRFAGADRAAVKDHLLGLFQLVDPADPRLKVARTSLASALF